MLPIQTDVQLLMLERMRMIDCSNAWSPGTSRAVSSNLRQISRFAVRHNVPWNPTRPRQDMEVPPCGPSIVLLWTMEWYTLQETGRVPGERIRYNTARHLRSALHNLSSWEGTLLPEGLAFREKDRLHVPPLVSASGSLVVQLTSAGLERRLGTDSNPSIALQDCHVRANLGYREQIITTTCQPQVQYQHVLAQLAESLLWLGWLRGGEVFGLRWEDIEVVRPSLRPKYGLPPRSGALLLRLLEATKGDQTRTADHIIAYTTASGLSPGTYFETAYSLRPATARPSDYIFLTESGRRWNSYHFRETYMYPGLTRQWHNQDPHLRTFAPRSPEDLPKKFYSLHSYRRGGRTHVSKKRDGCARKATQLETTDHGRWRTRYNNHSDMPLHYQETTLEDRLYITLLCH